MTIHAYCINGDDKQFPTQEVVAGTSLEPLAKVWNIKYIAPSAPSLRTPGDRTAVKTLVFGDD